MKQFTVNLLIVDDDPSMVDLIRALLLSSTLADYRISGASNSIEALDSLNESRFHLCLIDNNLNCRMTGIEVIEEVRARNQHIPMILVTADASEHVDFQAIQAGAAGFIHKEDLSRTVLDRTIRYALSRHEQIKTLATEKQAHKRPLLCDALTGLPNRREFDSRLAKTIEYSALEGSSFALIYINLNKFKAINDRYGHDVGDQVLCVTAARLLGEFRSEDSLARVGGGQFVAIVSLPENATCLHTVCELLISRLRQRLKQKININKTLVEVSASFGIAEYPANGLTAAALIKWADTAMCKEKTSTGQ